MVLKIKDPTAIIGAASAILFALWAAVLALRERLSCSAFEASSRRANHPTTMARSLPKYTFVARFARTCATPMESSALSVRAILFFWAIEHEDEESLGKGGLFNIRMVFNVFGKINRYLPHRRFPLTLATDAFLKRSGVLFVNAKFEHAC
jgi:hypothetical protein